MTLWILKDVGNWDWRLLIAMAGLFIGGTFVVRFTPNFLYKNSSYPRLRRMIGIAFVVGGIFALYALYPRSYWRWFYLFGMGILLVVSGIVYILLSDLQCEKSSNPKFSLIKRCQRLFRKWMGN